MVTWGTRLGSKTKVCLKVSLFLGKRSSEISKVLLFPTNGLVPQVSSGELSQWLVTYFHFPGDLDERSGKVSFDCKQNERSCFLTDNNINSIHHKVELLANEPEVNVG